MVAVGTAAVLLAGCGGGPETRPEPAAGSAPESPQDLQEVWVSLDGRAGAENVGILMAQELGYFEEVGLSVAVGSPLEPRRSIRYVVDQTDDLGVAQMPQVVLAKGEGKPVVAVGSLLPQPTAAMIWLRSSKIRGLADLKGKTVAFPGVPFQEGFLRILLARAGLSPGDVKIEDVGYDLVPALVSGRADAIFGASGNLEGARLESRGLEPVVTPVRRLGIPAYDELVVVARTRRAARSPQLVRDFMSALARGNAAAAADPEAAVRAIETNFESDRSQSRKAIEAQVEATLPLLSGGGYVSPGRVGRLVAWMRRQGLIQRKPVGSELFTNRYLPPQP